MTTCWRNKGGSTNIVRVRKCQKCKEMKTYFWWKCSERITFSPQDLISAVRGCSISCQYEARNVQSCVMDVLDAREGGHMII